MNKLLRLILVAALLALGAWLWTALFSGPEKIIRKRLAEVARAASFGPNEGSLARFANVAKLTGYFSADIEVKIEALGERQRAFSGRDEITQAALAVRSAVSALKVEFLDVTVTMAPDRQSANADLTARAAVPGQKDFEVQEMNFALKKIDGEWLITRAETVKTLR